MAPATILHTSSFRITDQPDIRGRYPGQKLRGKYRGPNIGSWLGGKFLINKERFLKERFLNEVPGFYQMSGLKTIENFIKILPGAGALIGFLTAPHTSRVERQS
jgi:hypothetical protein